MTEAALVLGVSQSAVTQQVNKFETVTGIKLLRRVGNSLYVEREDIAELMERITSLGQQMERLVQDKATAKATLALPSAIANLIAINPALSAWVSERYHLEVLGFRDLAKQRGQNSSDLLIRPIRAREVDIDFQFDCAFVMMKPASMMEGAADGGVLPVVFPAGECPTHAAAVSFPQAHDIAFAEVGRSEDIAYRALKLSLGRCATPLPLGFAQQNLYDIDSSRAVPMGDAYPVRFGMEVIRQSPGQSGDMDFFESFCSQLKDYGVAMST
jgi:hypothetical protein